VWFNDDLVSKLMIPLPSAAVAVFFPPFDGFFLDNFQL
jgi:hypothetical protein